MLYLFVEFDLSPGSLCKLVFPGDHFTPLLVAVFLVQLAGTEMLVNMSASAFVSLLEVLSLSFSSCLSVESVNPWKPYQCFFFL